MCVGKNPETAGLYFKGSVSYENQGDQNDLCKSLEESVEHSSKFMVLCIQP